MTVKECLLHKAKAKDLVLFIYRGYWVGTTFIDYEDLFLKSLNNNFISQEVKTYHYEVIEEFNRQVFVIVVGE